MSALNTGEEHWCDCGPDQRCFECATDEELASAIPPWPDR